MCPAAVERCGYAKTQRVPLFEFQLGDHPAPGMRAWRKRAVAGVQMNFRMARDVIRVGVRDERPRHPALSIEPPADLRQVNALSMCDIPGHASVKNERAQDQQEQAERRAPPIPRNALTVRRGAGDAVSSSANASSGRSRSS